MRFFLLPISARRTLIYCDKHHLSAAQKTLRDGASESVTPPSGPQKLADRLSGKVASSWTAWEKETGGWKKTVTVYGNSLLRRIPYEEWGLKSIPPLSRRREEESLAVFKEQPIQVLFPSSVLNQAEVPGILQSLGSERQDFHRKMMIRCGIGAPLTLPFALVPIIPNIPGFYVLFRLWSHYRALYGSKHLQFIVANKLFEPSPSSQLDNVYSTRAGAKDTVESSQTKSDTLLLTQESGSTIAKEFGVDEIAVEIERAVEQVEKKLIEEKATSAPNHREKKEQ